MIFRSRKTNVERILQHICKHKTKSILTVIILFCHWVVLLNGGKIILSGLVGRMKNFICTRVVFVSDPLYVLEICTTGHDKIINLLKKISCGWYIFPLPFVKSPRVLLKVRYGTLISIQVTCLSNKLLWYYLICII